VRTYSTTSGDTFDIVALRALGDEAHTGLVIAANPEHAETVVFSAGVVLNIPPKPETPAHGALPAWRQ